MRGLPKRVSSRGDVEALMAYLDTPAATPERLRWGLAKLRGLKTSRHKYVFDRVLADGEDPDGTEPEYRVLDSQGESQDERHQFKRVDDPDGRIFRLGLSESEVDQWINQLMGKL